MKAIEFRSKISNNRILIPKKVQSELRDANEKNVRIMILLDEIGYNDTDLKGYDATESEIDVAKDELESINNGLKDFEEGKILPHKTARKLYEKYL